MPAIPPGDLARHLLFVTTPALWPAWPFLPVTRRAGGAFDLGRMFDARGPCGLTGYSATVFACNLFTLPPTVRDSPAGGTARRPRRTSGTRLRRSS